MIADDLRRQADFFLDVAELAKTVGRPPSAERVAVDRSLHPADDKGKWSLFRGLSGPDQSPS